MKLFFAIVFFILLFGCNNHNENNKIEIIKVKQPQNVDAEVKNILNELHNTVKGDTLLIIDNDTLVTYPYFKNIINLSQLNYIKSGKATVLGDTLFLIIKRARQYGLYAKEYHFKTLDSLKNNFFNEKDSTYNVTNIAKFEALLTDAYLLFGAHLNKGRFAYDTLLREWNPLKLDTNWLSILKYGIDSNKVRFALDSLEPKHEGYKFLKKALRKYIFENEKLSWDSISFTNVVDTPALKKKLKQRFIETGYYNDSLKVNDSLKLAKAIKKFQATFNLETDGKLGKYTKQALGLDKEKTIRQIEMALERWRWEPAKYPKQYAIVNIPSAMMHVWEWDKKHKVDTLVLKSKVVVGKPENQTPTLKSKINYMMIYPYWNVPYKIAYEEILPAVQRDTNYLHKKNFEVIDGSGKVVTNLGKLNWKRFNKNYLPVKFRQRIGNENSLGICKFNFNNKYGVYLHDTNSKRYFKTFYRFQSHGCMRLEQFDAFARFLIREDTLKIPYDTLTVYFSRQEQKQINIKKPLQLYVRYYTSTIDSVGNLQKYIDIYRNDEQMMKLVYKN